MLLLLAALPLLWWEEGPASAPLLREHKVAPVAVRAPQEWQGTGVETLALPPGCTTLKPPGVQYRSDLAGATAAPWLDAHGWRMVRTPRQPFCYDGVPTDKLALVAAEAFAHHGEAVYIRPAAPDGLLVLTRALDFLRSVARPPEPPLANIAVVDDGSPLVGEVLNLMARRNLMYRSVPKPARGVDLLVRIDADARIGRQRFPRAQAQDPSGFAQQVRYELTDDRRLLRIYGSEVVLGRLTGTGRHVRLHLLNYGPRPVEGLRVRLRGALAVERAAALGQPDFRVEDVATERQALEFTVAKLETYAVLDLTRQRR